MSTEIPPVADYEAMDAFGLGIHNIRSTLNAPQEIALRDELAAANEALRVQGEELARLKASNIRMHAALENIYNNTLGFESDDPYDQELIDEINRDSQLALPLSSPTPTTISTVPAPIFVVGQRVRVIHDKDNSLGVAKIVHIDARYRLEYEDTGDKSGLLFYEDELEAIE